MCDGEPTDLQKRAMDSYATLWRRWRGCVDAETRESFETEMDFWQERVCCGRPCPRWRAFIDGLDGYVAFWEKWGESAKLQVVELLARIPKNEDVNFLLTKSI